MIFVSGMIDGFEIEGFFESVEAARIAGFTVIEQEESEQEANRMTEKLREVVVPKQTYTLPPLPPFICLYPFVAGSSILWQLAGPYATPEAARRVSSGAAIPSEIRIFEIPDRAEFRKDRVDA